MAEKGGKGNLAYGTDTGSDTYGTDTGSDTEIYGFPCVYDQYLQLRHSEPRNIPDESNCYEKRNNGIDQDQAERLERLEKTSSEYKERMRELERTFAELARDQAAKIQTMEMCLEYQAERLESPEKTISSDQAAKIKDQAERIEKTTSEYKERVGELERTVAALTRDQAAKIQTMEMRLEDQAKRLASQEKTINVTRQRNIRDDVGPIMFNAFFNESVEVKYKGINQKIVFPFVATNLGSGYQNSTGVFTAPRAGIYLFSTTIASTNSGDICTAIVQNGNHIGYAYANAGSGHCDQGSTTSVAHLAKGHEVWVRVARPADASHWGGASNSFMGCLVFPL